MLPATRPLPEEDPFLEACLAMEEGRCDENAQGQLKTVLEKLAKEQFSPRAEIAELQEMLPAARPLPEEDPFLEAWSGHGRGPL